MSPSHRATRGARRAQPAARARRRRARCSAVASRVVGVSPARGRARLCPMPSASLAAEHQPPAASAGRAVRFVAHGVVSSPSVDASPPVRQTAGRRRARRSSSASRSSAPSWARAASPVAARACSPSWRRSAGSKRAKVRRSSGRRSSNVDSSTLGDPVVDDREQLVVVEQQHRVAGEEARRATPRRGGRRLPTREAPAQPAAGLVVRRAAPRVEQQPVDPPGDRGRARRRSATDASERLAPRPRRSCRRAGRRRVGGVDRCAHRVPPPSSSSAAHAARRPTRGRTTTVVEHRGDAGGVGAADVAVAAGAGQRLDGLQQRDDVVLRAPCARPAASTTARDRVGQVGEQARLDERGRARRGRSASPARSATRGRPPPTRRWCRSTLASISATASSGCHSSAHASLNVPVVRPASTGTPQSMPSSAQPVQQHRPGELRSLRRSSDRRSPRSPTA